MLVSLPVSASASTPRSLPFSSFSSQELWSVLIFISAAIEIHVLVPIGALKNV